MRGEDHDGLEQEGKMSSSSQLWAVVLAGGDGRRMATVTNDPQGQHVPKQFCRFGSERPLLQRALERASRHADRAHTLVIVQAAHRPWWNPELQGVPAENILVQPSNRGTAVALLHAVTTLLERDRDPYLLVLPSDHEVEDEHTWGHALRRASEAAFESREQLVLIGVEPQDDPDYGWLLPGRRSADGTHPVLSFVEKPDPTLAAHLARQGGLCSTFAFATSASALLNVFLRHAGPLVEQYALWLRRCALAPERMSEAHGVIPALDFSRDILEQAPEEVRVYRCPPCGWTDLGTPRRLDRWIERRNATSRWLPTPLDGGREPLAV